ncbi:hypothetical protein [Micromonospora sp. NPDC006431]|uniref:hypothetical protein n=1 Tax=Micromonospora sp. NPDC006431 TaxID=3364235 RepID=UPI003694931D
MTREDDRELLKAAHEAWDLEDWAVAGGAGAPEPDGIGAGLRHPGRWTCAHQGGKALPASRVGDHTASGSVGTYA